MATLPIRGASTEKKGKLQFSSNVLNNAQPHILARPKPRPLSARDECSSDASDTERLSLINR